MIIGDMARTYRRVRRRSCTRWHALRVTWTYYLGR
jgi:hypothetical protein